MAATPQNVEMEAAKFLHKLIQESKDEPTKLATKLHVILQHMRSSGKENSMPYQVISRAMETVINRHGLDMEALMSSRPPLSSGTQPGDSPLSQIAGPSQQTAVENDSKKPLATEDTTKIATFSKPLHGSSSAGHDIYQGSANQLNSIKNHGSNAGFSGSYESAEPGNPLSMQFSNSYDNQSAATLMHKSPAGKALDYEGGFPNVIANASKTVQGGISNNIAEASRDTGKLPVVQATPAGPSMPFKEHHLKQLRAQCLVFLAFRNNLMPKKLHLEIALGNFFSKEDPSSKEHIDQKGKEQSIGGQSSGFISETNLLKEGDKIDRMMDKSEPTYGEGMRNNPIPRKVEAEMPVFEAKESQTSATRVPQSDPSNIALHADSQGNRHGHNSHLPSWKPHSGMEGERHMVVQKTANILEKDVILGNKHEGEDTSELSTSPASPKYTTSEKWIADCQKRKVAADNNWAVKKMKTEQRISACVDKLKETVSSSEDISAKTRSVIELKKLELLNLQRRLRNDILKNYFRPISNEMDRLKSIKKSRIGRRSKQLERYEQKMKEERQKRIRERQKDFFGEMEMHKERLEDVHKFRRERAKGFNKYVREFHKKKERLYREKIDRIQREKINLLKINDVEGYLRMVKDAKSDRVKQLLKETEKYLQKLGSKLKEAKVISRCFETDNGVNDSSEFTIENEDETDQAKHYMESNEKYYMMAHSVKEIVAEQPATLIGGKLREYQMNGLRWLLSLYNNHLNGILADEMGLGKTVQVISLLCYLMENKNDRGPFLVVVPSSVLPGWESEINFWAPTINKIVYSGHPEERRKLFKEKIVQQKFNVLLTTYEYLMNKHDRPKLSKIHWHYVIIDEGHRIKNASCKLNAELKHYHSSHRLLLTGTPLQNNLEELWALLNFLLPNIFNSAEDFSQWFNKPFESNADNSLEEALLSEEENLLIINRLHQVLRPFVLRRLKHKVENELPEKIERLVRCESSAYQKILMQRVEDNMGAFGASKSRGVHNTVVELRNICNHPYLSQLHTEQVHDFLPKHFLPNVIRFCGKLEMLDRLLPKLKATDHRVLLFSTMTRLLDVMEDYLYWKQYKYLRLDGHTHGGDRGSLIDQFNKPGSPFFIFLLSIRAGGVGVNLQAADTVIIFDTDWNPQVDLQAQARAHRIGQKKDVLVLRLETVKSVEEQVRASAEHKLGVANQSITAGFFDNNTSAEDRREYLEALLRECKKEEAAPVLNDDGLNDLIARSESEIDVFEELDKKRQEEELALWKKVVSEQGGTSGEFILPPLPSRLVTEDDMKSFCEAMKAIEVPKPVILPGIAGKRKSELGNLDTHNYGRGKRAREVRSYEEQWTEDEFEKMCQVEAAPDSPKEEDLGIVKAESAMVITNIQPLQIEANPPSKRGRGRPPKKKPPGIGVPPPTFHPLGMQIVPSPSVSVSNPTDTLSLPPTTNPTLSVPPGFQPTTASPPPPGFPLTDPPPGYKPITAPPPGYQPLSTPPGYQPIAPPPPGFQPIIPSSSPSTTASLSTSQPTTINSPPLLHITTPATQPTDTLPSPDSQSADTSPSATSGRGRGRGRGRGGRGRGRGRSRGQGRGRGRIFESGVDEPQRRVIIESGVDERQRRGRKPHHVVLAIPGFRTLNNPQAASPPVSETANELSVSNPSSAINAASHKPLVETFKSDIPSHPAKPVSGLPDPDIPTTSPLLSVASQATPPQVSVASQATPPQVSVASQAMLPPVSAGSETMAPPVPVGSEAMPSTIPVGSEAMPSPVPVGLETTPPPGPVGSEATRSPVPVGSETMPPPVLVGSQATPPPVSVGSQAPPPVPVDSQTPVPPVSVDLQATQPPVCVDSQAAPPPVSVGSQATTPPVCVDSQATTPPVSVNSQATTPLVSEASPPAVPVSYQATVPLPVSVDSQATAPSVSTDSQATAPLVSVGSEATPPPVPVSSQATVPLPVSVGSEATTPPVSVSFEATEVGNSSPASAGLKQSRGRGRKIEASTPRRRERKKVDSEENETPQKKTRASTGRKSVATRSMLRNEAQKMIDKASDDSAPIPQESNTSPQKDISVEAAAKTDDAVQKEDLDPKPCKEADQATKDNETQVEQQATKDNETLVEQQATKDNETQVTVAEKDVQIAEENVGETVEANPVEENVADVQIGTESEKEQGANDTNKASPELDTMQEAEEGKIEKEEVVVAQGSGNEDPHDDSGNPT